jgi:hypothetical protein
MKSATAFPHGLLTAAEAELVLPDVLPGFRIPLRQFFE